jgi:Phytanoyl-CoA dioxygenase (PhyH)
MSLTDAQLAEFRRSGYLLLKDYFDPERLSAIAPLFLEAHKNWASRHYAPAAVNSAYLTAPDCLPDPVQRRVAFEFIASNDLTDFAGQLIGAPPRFLNTQLFFNPEDPARKPYWHRDVQYFPISEEEQHLLMQRQSVLHFRIPLAPDPGMEFIPGSHARGDTELERATRLELDGRRNFEELPEAVRVPHSPGDLLIFSAHLIHRGVYDLDRRSLDILYTNFPEDAATVARIRHFPDREFAPDLAASFVYAVEIKHP